MKKYLRISIFVLIVSIVLSVSGISAYENPGATVYNSIKIGAGKIVQKDPRTKTTATVQQYRNIASSTSLTSDCTDCKITTTLYQVGRVKMAKLTTVKGDVKDFNNSSDPGDYYLTFHRSDSTLLTTTHSGQWFINIRKS